MSAPPAVAGFDLADPQFIASPHRVFHEMRSAAPICRLPGGEGWWAITSYEHVRALVRDPRLAPTPNGGRRPQQHSSRAAVAGNPLVRAMVESRGLFERIFHGRAPDDHMHLRRILRAPFMPARVAARRGRIEEIVTELVDRGVARGGMDVVGEFARPLAVTIAAEVVGIPESHRQHFAAREAEIIRYMDVAPTALESERGLLATFDLASRVRAIVAASGSCSEEEPTLLDLLTRAHARGEITEEDVVAHGAFMFIASYVTTQHFMSNAILSLVRNPDQWEQLRTEPDRTATAVEELIRYDSPFPVMRRYARADIEIAGVTIPRGSLIMLLVPAANRDPAVFDEPDRLDITRSPNPHLGFGHDAHHCVGAVLARLEGKIALRTLVDRVATARLDGDSLEWDTPFMVRGLKALPLTFEAAR